MGIALDSDVASIVRLGPIWQVMVVPIWKVGSARRALTVFMARGEHLLRLRVVIFRFLERRDRRCEQEGWAGRRVLTERRTQVRRAVHGSFSMWRGQGGSSGRKEPWRGFAAQGGG